MSEKTEKISGRDGSYRNLKIIVGVIAGFTLILTGLINLQNLVTVHKTVTTTWEELCYNARSQQEFVDMVNAFLSEQRIDACASIFPEKGGNENGLKIEWVSVNRWIITLFERNKKLMSALRRLGFKTIIITNGTENWNVIP